MNDREQFEAWWNLQSNVSHRSARVLEVDAMIIWKACAESMREKINNHAFTVSQDYRKVAVEQDKANARIAQLEEFVQTCVEAAGYEINGNRMSHEAKDLLAESPDTWLSEHDKEVEVKVLEDVCNKGLSWTIREVVPAMIKSRKSTEDSV